MLKEKILIADRIDNSGLELLKEKFSVSEYYGFNNNQLLLKLKKIKPMILIVRSYRKIDRNFIDKIYQYDTIRYICTASSGYNNIDVTYANKHNIKIINVPNGNYISAAEHTFSLILSIFKNINSADLSLRKGEFNESKFINHELSKKSIGIVGVGRVGSKVAEFAKAFGMNIYGNDIKNLQSKYKWIKFVTLNNLLQKSNIITFHTPLDETTINLLNKSNFKLLKKDAVIINCSRGGVINEETLINYLKLRKLKFAGLDVFDNEPNINREFFLLDNVLLTPHIAGKTVESKKRISLLLAKRVKSLLRVINKRN
jgi:D-3-phosphoglycerate dehydrogenase / 2-oxoglutarate reductase